MSGNKGGAPGAGQGRRMPVQQSVDIGVPVETVYNQWTQFEDWPSFMHRVTRVTQEDDCTVSFATKIWGKTKEFSAKIETQRPNERIKWSVSQGMTHTGVVTFHELGPNLTRVMLTFDVEPGSLIEKAARGMRHVKRAARGDLHRFKAFIEIAENETGAWRGTIEDGELVEEHDPSYDEEREFSDVQELTDEHDDDESDEDEDESDDQEGDEEEPRAEEDSEDDEDEESDEDEEDSDEDEEDSDDEPAAKRSRRRAQPRNRSQGSKSGGSSGSRSGSSGRRSGSSRNGAQASGRRTRSRSGNR